ncbi:spindle assembly abnormal protein 6 homolog [Copidosoma floridanum]|uniref:spindle assembly abnormal protein 6 homolog n=1 Tax=Copidosoma floridanum TaxID=29053 RepID=UPI0006C9D7D9|nr:spindle assembly abnormal protein 6 homolog [Copidosoma floridanum]
MSIVFVVSMNFVNTIVGGVIAGSEAGLQLNNVEVIYSKIQRVYVKQQQKEERQRELRVNVEIHAGLSPVCRKALCVLLADDNDPCFLYSLFITDDDFKVLKAQQGLLVDFDNFATQLICLLEQCISQSSAVSKTSKFLLLLSEEGSDWSFKLVETNNFKHLCHLSLNIAPANDSDLKTHMAIKIKSLKESVVQKDRDTASLEVRLSELSNKLELKCKEFEQYEQKCITEKTQLQLSLSQQTIQEKNRLTQAKLEWQNELEKEKMELEYKHSELVKQLHFDLAELRTQNASYKEKQLLLEATNAEQSKRIQELDKDLNFIQRNFSVTKRQNAKLDTDYHEKDKSVNVLSTRVAVLEQELKDKIVLINKHADMIKTTKESKQRLEELLSEKDTQLQRKQASLKNISDELIKANEIIGKLQIELASVKSKLKLRTSIALEQERLLNSKQIEIGQLESKVEILAKESREAIAEVEKWKNQAESLQAQLEEKEKAIKNNDNVINWLNRRLADVHTPLQSATTVLTTAPIALPSSIQLTLPRTNKFMTNRFEPRASAGCNTATGAPQPLATLSGLTLRNSIALPNSNLHLPSARGTSRSTGVGVTDNVTSIITNLKSGNQLTSTPIERAGSQNKLTSVNTMMLSDGNEDINGPVSTVAMNSGTLKPKNSLNTHLGGLKRTMFNKPLLPSSYFPKTLQN